MYKNYCKRIIDFTLALIGLIVISPFLAITIILVKLSSPGPIFFVQERLGKNGEKFNLYKLRTMTHKKRESHQEVFKGNPEVTIIGNYLRRFKIDELPQIINVLKGDMSLIGPRPSLPSLAKDFNEDGIYRIMVKPGLTGLAQVNGNINLSWEERWKYDRVYVENLSFEMDIKILLKTVAIVILGEDKFINKSNV